MRKPLYFSAAIAALFATSCSNDMVQPAGNDGDGNVMVKLTLPENMATRAFGDGLTASKLQYAVYHTGSQTPIINSEATFNGLETVLNLQLVNGQTYDFVFWAADPNGSHYSFDAANQTVTVDYSSLSGNDETRDAFFGQLTGVAINGPASLEATLKRPFAQINLGSNDLSLPAVTSAYPDFKSSLTVAGLPTALNLLNGSVSGDAGNVVFGASSTPTGEIFPVGNYDYVSMNYILVGSEKEVKDLTFDFHNGENKVSSLPLSSVPVQRNYRTNIYGSVLTSPADITVKIEPTFDEPDNNYEVPNVVETAEDLAFALKKGGLIEVPADAALDLTTVNNGEEIVLAANTVLKINGSVNTARAQLSVKSGTVTVDGEGVGKITSVGFATGSRPLNVFDDAILIVKNIEIETEQNNGGSAIYSLDGNLELENVTVNCHHFAVAATGGTLKAKDCVFNSDSNNREGTWSYTIDVAAGCKAELDNCEVNGVQGGISVGNENSVVTINSGTYTTKSLKEFTGQTAFYPVYIFDKGLAIINGGDFISGCEYTIFNGNNDVPEFYVWGNGACLQGGRYNKGTINQASHLTYPAAEGYEWVAIEGDDVFKFEVVKKGE